MRAVARAPRLCGGGAETSPCGPPSDVQHVEFALERWRGPVGDWSEHFGKGRGQTHSLNGSEPLRSCKEVEAAKRLRTVREHAFWFSGCSPTAMPDIWAPWVRSLGANTPEWLAALNAAIRKCIRSTRGGMPDVAAWNTREPVALAIFLERKGPNERISEAQEDWGMGRVPCWDRALPIAVSVRPFR